MLIVTEVFDDNASCCSLLSYKMLLKKLDILVASRRGILYRNKAAVPCNKFVRVVGIGNILCCYSARRFFSKSTALPYVEPNNGRWPTESG
jgi:hypothetical protein